MLPTVEWGGHSITRLLLGHNPFKGMSHFSRELDAEMKEWHDPAAGEDLALMRRAEECGINTCQFGGAVMHDRLRRHAAAGGKLQWIATLYDAATPWNPSALSFEEELAQIAGMDPRPIGLQYWGNSTDRHFIDGRMGLLRDKMKRARDTGLLIGVCSHLPEALESVEEQGWDVDFYETCFYTTYARLAEGKIDRTQERYEAEDRDRMVAFICRTRKPCLAFKVLAANRSCATDADVRTALEFAYAHIKPTDVAAVGMWQKHRDQVGQNVRWVEEILARSAERQA